MDGDAYAKFFAEFMKESDRAALVLGAAHIDSLLGRILPRRLVHAKKELFDFNGPLRSFSARIDMARATGVIDKEFSERLHLVRKIRNDCAHDIERVDLNSQAATQRIVELSKSFSGTQFWAEVLRNSASVFKMSGNSLSLRFAVACLIANLALMLPEIEVIDSASARSVVVPRQ